MKGEPDITYTAELQFKGSISEFEDVLSKLSELPANGIKIGTWPTPDHPAGGLMIDTVPLPEQPNPGILPIARLLSKELLDKLLGGQSRFKLITDIHGGIRNAHIHLGNEIVLLDRQTFRGCVTKDKKDHRGSD